MLHFADHRADLKEGEEVTLEVRDGSGPLVRRLAGAIDAELAALKKLLDEDLRAFNDLAARASVPAARTS